MLHLVDVFPDTVGEGNRAGVVIDADGLDAAAMLRIPGWVWWRPGFLTK